MEPVLMANRPKAQGNIGRTKSLSNQYHAPVIMITKLSVKSSCGIIFTKLRFPHFSVFYAPIQILTLPWKKSTLKEDKEPIFRETWQLNLSRGLVVSEFDLGREEKWL